MATYLFLHQGIAGGTLLAACVTIHEEEIVLAAVTLIAHEAGPAHTCTVVMALG